jgi:hypothetical protein
MMGHHEQKIGGDEHDALSHRAKRLFRWRPRARKLLKRKFNKRVRKHAVQIADA